MDDDRSLSDKLSGRFRHPDDAGARTILTGRIIRSPGHSRRVSVLEIPEYPEGVVSLISRDIPGASRISLGGVQIPVLSGRDLLWEGQPILIAAGPDAEELDDWVSRIRMNFSEESPEIEAPEENHFNMSRGRVDEGFSKAFQVIEELIDIPSAVIPASSRSVSCIRDGSAYVLHAATSWPGAIRRSVSRVLKTDRKNVRVRPYPATGGSKGPLWLPAVDSCRVALLAKAARKSVRLTTSAEDAEKWDHSSPDAVFKIRGAVDGEGKVLALDISFTLKTGVFFPLEGEFLDRMIMGLFSVYPCKTYRIEGRIQKQKRPPSGHGPAIGFELGFLAGEVFASRVAEHSLVPPGTWRRESLPVSGQPYGPGITMPRDFPLPELLSTVVGISDFERKYASFEQTRLGSRNLEIRPVLRRGIGLSCAWFGNGFVASPKELGAASLSITLDKEGILTIDVPAHTVGSAMLRAWAGMAGEILGIESKSVRFPAELSLSTADPGPSVMGRNASVYTKLIELAFNDLSRRRFRDALPITVSRIRRRNARQPWDSQHFEGTAFEAVSWGSAVVEVGASTGTGSVIPTRVWIAIDGGKLLMPNHARSAVENSVQNALDWCFGITSGSSGPIVDIHFHEPGSRKPAKDVSTIPWLTVPAACIQAVRQATGIDSVNIPLSRRGPIEGGCQ